MRFCIVGPAPPLRGGIPRTTAAIHAALSERDASRLVALRRLYPAPLFPGRFERERDDPQDPLGARLLGGVVPALDGLDPTTWTLAAARIAEFRPDVVVLPWWSTYWAPLLLTLAAALRRRTRAPLVLLCHQLRDHEPSALTRLATRLVLRSMDGAMVPTEDDARTASSIAPRIRVAVYGPLPARGLVPVAVEPREALRRRLGIEGPTALAFGLVRPYKGIETLLRALPEAAREADWRLIVAGESWRGEGARLRALARALGVAERVRFDDRFLPGADAGALLRACDIVALAYERAGHSGVAGVALEHGRPLLVSRAGQLPAFVDEGASGAIVPPGDPAAVARALVDFVRNARHDGMSRAAEARRGRIGLDLRAAILRAAGISG